MDPTLGVCSVKIEPIAVSTRLVETECSALVHSVGRCLSGASVGVHVRFRGECVLVGCACV